MPLHDVPCDVLMNDRDNVECGTRGFHSQSVDHGNTDCAEPNLIAKAKADVKRSISNHGPERLQDYLRRVGYRTIARQFANAYAIDANDWRQHMQVDRATVIISLRPSHLFPLFSPLLLSFGFPLRRSPRN
jgi:hypothetical protein